MSQEPVVVELKCQGPNLWPSTAAVDRGMGQGGIVGRVGRPMGMVTTCRERVWTWSDSPMFVCIVSLWMGCPEMYFCYV